MPGLTTLVMLIVLPALLVHAAAADRHFALSGVEVMRRVRGVGGTPYRCGIAFLRHIGLAFERAFELLAGLAGHAVLHRFDRIINAQTEGRVHPASPTPSTPAKRLTLMRFHHDARVHFG